MIKHFLSIEDLQINEIAELLMDGKKFLNQRQFSDILKGQLFFNVFFEDSTRTISSFSTAATKLGASIINLNMQSSSKNKGETEIDTMKNLAAMGADFIAIRHPENMVPHICAKHLDKNGFSTKILNGGDGCNEHPTQALGDLLTILTEFNCEIEDIKKMKIAIFGDIKQSRVAHSHIKLYNMLGIKNVHLIAPPELSCDYRGLYDNLNYHTNMSDGIADADLIIALRFKKEYLSNHISSGIFDEFKSFYSLNHENIKLAKPNVKIMHPGPVNRGVELTPDICDDENYSLILNQVSCGVAMRQAIMTKLFLDNNKPNYN